jgi:hypothetical protein
LRNATGRAAEMVRFLCEMDRLQAIDIQLETVTLSVMVREFQGELQRRHPTVWLEYSWQWDVPTIRCDPRVMLQALHEMFEAILDPAAERCEVSGASRLKGDRIELTFSLSAPRKKLGPEPRMEFILAGEWLSLLGAEIERATPDDPARFTILAPVH